LATPPPPLLQASYDDLRAQLSDLAGDDVATAVGVDRLPHVVRYLTAMLAWIDWLPRDPQRDIALMQRVHAVEAAWHDALEQLPAAGDRRRGGRVSAPVPAAAGPQRPPARRPGGARVARTARRRAPGPQARLRRRSLRRHPAGRVQARQPARAGPHRGRWLVA